MALKQSLFGLLALSSSVAAYGQGVKILGNAGTSVNTLKLSVVADARVGLKQPADLAFNPINPNDLYVMNHGENSAVVLSFDDARSAAPKLTNAVLNDGPGSAHFMTYPSSLAFADNGFFATIHDTDKVTQPMTPADFMGPTLWTQEWFEGGQPSHMDMLHNSPNGVGIAWVHGNAYVVNDGYHGSLTVYDFRHDHGHGGEDHSDGVVLRYADGLLKQVKGVPSHVVYDREAGIAYAVDTGNRRIVSIDLGLAHTSKAGFDYIMLKNTEYKVNRRVQPNYDGGTQVYVDGAELKTVLDGTKVGLVKPSGLAVHDGVLYVSDYATAQIVAFGKDGQVLDRLSLSDVSSEIANASLAGLEFDAEGRLYLVDRAKNRIFRLSAGN